MRVPFATAWRTSPIPDTLRLSPAALLSLLLCFFASFYPLPRIYMPNYYLIRAAGWDRFKA